MEEVLESILFLYDKKIKAKQINLTKQYKFKETLQSVADTPGVLDPCGQRNGGLQVPAVLRCVPARPVIGETVLSAEGVRITLADSGSGIHAENIARIFEPFFTTKGEKGTGLWGCG